jgi:hypothetical protein
MTLVGVHEQELKIASFLESKHAACVVSAELSFGTHVIILDNGKSIL